MDIQYMYATVDGWRLKSDSLNSLNYLPPAPIPTQTAKGRQVRLFDSNSLSCLPACVLALAWRELAWLGFR